MSYLHSTAEVAADVSGWTSQQIEQLRSAIEQIANGNQLALASSGSSDVEMPATPSDNLSAAASTGWTLEVYGAIVTELFQGHGVQAKAIMTAVNNGGFVSRDEVYELGGYAENRSLKGFTRPSNRITQRYQDEGQLPEDADELLAPVYDAAVKGYQRVKGFEVPLEVVKLVRDNVLSKASG